MVRRGFAAWNAGDMDACRELLDLEISWRPGEGWPEPGPYVGRDAVMRQLEQLRETWDTETLEPINARITAIEFFRDHAETLKTLGLSE